jgi:hypothetical protein
MTPDERRSLAEQITTNPLFHETLSVLETAAIDRGVYAPMTDDDTRAAAMAEIRAIRAFRQHLEAALQDTPTRKGAPA